MDTIKEIESIRNDILDTIAKCECGDDCESVVYLKKIAGRLSSVSSCCRPLALASAASPAPDGAAPSAPVPSVPPVPEVPSNEAKLREALALARRYISLCPDAESRADVEGGEIKMLFACDILKCIDAALAATSSEVPSNTAKLRETMELFAHANDDGFYGSHQTLYNVVKKAKEALDTPVRNCDRFTSEDKAQVAFLNEVWLISVKDLSQDPFDGWTEQMKERYAKWLMEPAKESEATK